MSFCIWNCSYSSTSRTTILTVYTLRPVDIIDAPSVIPMVFGATATVVLHLWKANMLLSIAGGTASYALLVSTAFSA